jgi:protein farnesyltransferase/geranylgeranyltransferase type-1 subunit alpha
VRRFELDPETELQFTNRLIETDILNNSAWSHRFYCLFSVARENGVKEEVVEAELQNVQTIIRKLSSNVAAWNYLRGYVPVLQSKYSVLKKTNRPLSSIESFALEFAPEEETATKARKEVSSDTDASEVSAVSVHAMDVLAEINADKNPKLAKFYLKELAGKYDTMRKNYWEFRVSKLGKD